MQDSYHQRLLSNKSLTAMTACSLLLSLTALGSDAYAAAPARSGPTAVADDLGGIADSALLSTPIVAEGTLANADQTPAAETSVALYAWPDTVTLKSLVVGDTVNLQPVAKATTDANGKYSLRIASLSSLSPVAAKDGTVNFQIIARSGTQMTAFSFGRKVAKPAGSAVAVLADTATDAANITAATASKPVTAKLTLVAGSLGASSQRGGSEATGAGDDSAPGAVAAAVPGGVLKDFCTTTYVQDMGLVWSIVGQTYSSTTGVNHSFTYLSGANSDLGVGFSVSGGGGTWSQSGTFSTSSQATIGFPTYGNNSGVYYKTTWDYGKYKYSCYNPAGILYYTSYSVSPRAFAGGAQEQSASIPSAPKCTIYSSGSTFTRTSTNAITWSNGVSIKGTIGVDLSAKTGYSSAATVNFKFNAERRLCGVGDYPGGANPYQFVATA